MNLEELEITINPNGQVEVRVRGVKGSACLEITKGLEDALGGEILLREMTPEALEQNNTNVLNDHLDINGF